MDIILNRVERKSHGVFGELLSLPRRDFLFITLENPVPFGETYLTQLEKGIYKCVRKSYEVEDSEKDFETFDITRNGKVHSAFREGNYPHQFPGSVLIGGGFGFRTNKDKMIVSSLQAHKAFMDLQKDCDSFFLYVETSEPELLCRKSGTKKKNT